MAAIAASDHVHNQRLREFLLSNDRTARVQRELWSCNGVPYLAFRKYLSSLQHATHRGSQGHIEPGQAAAMVAAAAASAAHVASSTKYAFDGMRYVFDECKSSITVISFAKVRNDWLAFASHDGDLWFALLGDGTNEAPQLHKAPRIHARAILCLDWSFDNSQLLTSGEDGGICIWDTAERSCIRSISLRAGPVRACRFHSLNPNLAVVGTASGLLEVYNCSAGNLAFKISVAAAFQYGLQITALEVSKNHIFCGDSSGFIHVYTTEMNRSTNQLQGLKWHSKLKASSAASAATPSRAAVVQIQYISFCRATDTPVLLASCRDSTITIMRVHEKAHTIDLQCQCTAPPMARDIRAVVCPLSVIQDIPRVVMGGEDTNVYIYNVSGGTPKPVVVNTLKGHRTPVCDVSWAFDESLLASADCDGLVIVWKRAA